MVPAIVPEDAYQSVTSDQLRRSLLAIGVKPAKGVSKTQLARSWHDFSTVETRNLRRKVFWITKAEDSMNDPDCSFDIAEDQSFEEYAYARCVHPVPAREGSEPTAAQVVNIQGTASPAESATLRRKLFGPWGIWVEFPVQ